MRTYADILRRLAELLDEGFKDNKEEVVRQLKAMLRDLEEGE